MRKKVKCIKCGNEFWSKAKKNKFTKEVVASDSLCQRCKNMLRHNENLKQADKAERIRVEKMLKSDNYE